VAARAEELRRLCRAAFAVLAQGREEEFLATRVKPRISADGTWELVYEFSSPEELEDFRPADQDNSFIEYQAAPLLRGPAPPPRLYNGALILRGDRPLRHVLDFAAPLEIELVSSTVSYPDASVESTLYVVLCDDGYGSYALSSQVGNLYVLDKASGYQDSDQEPLQLFFDIKYHLRLVHDGTTLSSFLDGQSNRSVAAGGRTHGAVLLWPYSDTDQAVHRLVIRSKLDPAFLQRRKDEWIDAQMKELDPGPGGDGR